MIQGSVVQLQATVGVVFRLAGRPNVEIEFVVDTGFAGALTMPSAAVAVLGLPYHEEMRVTLADDSRLPIDVHRATIVWDGQDLDVAVLAMGRRPLLGTALLDGFNLNADFAHNGAVVVRRLP